MIQERLLSQSQFAIDVVRGLSKKHKEIPSKYFYNEKGSLLFSEIMKLPEYYLTNSEIEIFSLHKSSIVQRNKEKVVFVELGAGDASKTRILLDEYVRMDLIHSYVPVDISKSALIQLTENLLHQCENLNIEPIEFDFLRELPQIHFPNQKVIVAYIGSSLGNLTFQKSVSLLKKINKQLKTGDELMIGLDMVKDLTMLTSAYDDSNGTTKDFNLNLLERMNYELGADFDLNQYFHHASYHPREKAMHSHLISKKNQTVFFKNLYKEFLFQPYESIFLERSCKYSIEDIEKLALQSGFEVDGHYQDSNGWFVNVFFRK